MTGTAKHSGRQACALAPVGAVLDLHRCGVHGSVLPSPSMRHTSPPRVRAVSQLQPHAPPGHPTATVLGLAHNDAPACIHLPPAKTRGRWCADYMSTTRRGIREPDPTQARHHTHLLREGSHARTPHDTPLCDSCPVAVGTTRARRNTFVQIHCWSGSALCGVSTKPPSSSCDHCA